MLLSKQQLKALKILFGDTTKGGWTHDRNAENIRSGADDNWAVAVEATQSPQGSVNAEWIAAAHNAFPLLLRMAGESVGHRSDAEVVDLTEKMRIARQLIGFANSLHERILDPSWSVTTGTGDIDYSQGTAFDSPEVPAIGSWDDAYPSAEAIVFLMNNLSAIADLALRGAHAPELNETRIIGMKQEVENFFNQQAEAFFSLVEAPQVQILELRMSGEHHILSDDTVTSRLTETATGRLRLKFVVQEGVNSSVRLYEFIDSLRSVPYIEVKLTSEAHIGVVGSFTTIRIVFQIHEEAIKSSN